MSKQILKKNRRAFIKGLFSIVPLKIFYPILLKAEKEINYLLNGPLAGSFYYTKTKPGKWKKLIQSHIPILEVKKNSLLVSTLHEMKGYDHYIIKHIILDKKFNIISEKIFDPSMENPVSKHNIIGYSDRLYILSICNKHDTWLETIKL
mgnify:FL=1